MRPVPLPLAALAAGVVSAFAFQPVGWWLLMILAVAILCELIGRAWSGSPDWRHQVDLQSLIGSD